MPPPGTGGFYQVSKTQDVPPGWPAPAAPDFEDLNRIFRLVCDRLDAIEGRRGAVAFESDLNLNNHKATNAQDPASAGDLVTKRYADSTYGASTLVRQIQVGGSNPLFVGQLRGVLAQPQPASVPTVDVLPPVSTATEGQLAYFDGALYYFDNSSDPGEWKEIGSGSTRTLEDAATNTTSTIFTFIHTTTGTPASGFGSALLYQLENDAGVTNDAGSLDFVWNSPIDAAEYADFVVRLVRNGAALTERFRVLSAGSLLTAYEDTATNAPSNLATLQHSTSGTATVGFGSRLLYRLENGNGSLTDAGGSGIVWSDATSGSEDADFVVYLKTAGATIAEKFRVASTGNAIAQGSFLAAHDLSLLAATAFIGTFTHNITAGRTWSMPDADGTVALTTAPGTSGSDVNWTAAGQLNVPDASVSARGVVNTGTQEFSGNKTFGNIHVTGAIELEGALNHDGSTIGFFATAPATQQTVTGSTDSNAALESLLDALALYGLIIDGT